ncbi:MAG: hypothetical protein RLZZ326_3971, partial [Planctomycetota bacterium]
MKTNWTRQWWGRIHATLVWRRFRDRAISRVRRRSTRDWAKRMGLALLEPLEARAMLAADVATDRFDYSPGSTALITTFSDGLPGPDFQVGETVQFLVVRTDGLADQAPGNRPWLVTDGVAGFAPYVNDSGVRIAPDLDGLADGRIATDWFVEGQYVNASLEIRATGLASGASAIEQFRDSGYEILTDTTLTSLAPYTAADTITIAPGVTLTIDLAADATFAGTIAGNGSLTKTGAGTLTLSGTNTYTGTTRVTQGILELGSPSALSGSTYDANAADSGTIRFFEAANGNTGGSVITTSSLVNPSFEAVDASVYSDWWTDVRGSVGWYNSLNTGGPWNAGSTAPTAPAGNFDAIDVGSLTGGRYMHLASDGGSISGYNGAGAISQHLGRMEAGKTYTLTADVFGGNGNTGFDAIATLASDLVGGTTFATASIANVYQGQFSDGGLVVSYTATAQDAGRNLWITYATSQPGLGLNRRGGIDDIKLQIADNLVVPQGPSAPSRPLVSTLVNGSFEEIFDGASDPLYGGEPYTNIRDAAGWYHVVHTGAPWNAGSTYTAGPWGNYDGIAAESLTGARYMRLASDGGSIYGLNGYGAITQYLGQMEAGKTYRLTADVLGGLTAGPYGEVDIGYEVVATLESSVVGGSTFATASIANVSKGQTSRDGSVVSYTATLADAGKDLWIRYSATQPGDGYARRGGIDNVRLQVTGTAITPVFAFGGLTGSGNLDLGSNAITIGGNGASTTYSGVISGTGSVTKTGTGTLRLTGTNAYTDGTTIVAGTLALGANNVLPDTGAVTVSGGTLDLAGYADSVGAVTLAGGTILGGALLGGPFVTGSVAPVSTEIDPNDNGTPGFQIGDLGFATDLTGSFAQVSDTQYRAVVTGTIDSGNDADWDFWKVSLRAGDTIQIDLQGAPSGLGTLIDSFLLLYDGAGNLIAANDDFNGTLNSQITYTVPVTGDYSLVADSYGGYAGTYTLTTTVTRQPQIGTLTGSSYELQSGTVSAILAGSATLVKTGSGTVTLSAVNTYTGGTTITAGTLALGASNVLPDTGAVTVNGGTLDLGASTDAVGTLAGSGTVTTTTGLLTVINRLEAGLTTGNVALRPGATYAPTAGFSETPTASIVTVVGSVDLGGGALAFAASGTASIGQSVVIVANDGVDPVVGTFAGLADGGFLLANNGQTFRINYAGGDGNDVVLTRELVSLSVVGITVGSRPYDGTTAAPLGTSEAALFGLAVGDTSTTLQVGAVSGAYASPDAGSGKSVTVAGLSLVGPLADNYVLVAPTAIGTVTKAAATISVTPYTLTFDGLPHVATGTATGIYGEDLSSGLILGSTAHIDAGTYVDRWQFISPNPNYADVTSTPMVTWLDDDFPAQYPYREPEWFTGDESGSVYSGTQSLDLTAWGVDQYVSYSEGNPLAIPADGVIKLHVWLDPDFTPSAIALQINTAERGWESRAVWGEQYAIYWGEYWNPVSPSHFMMGGIPATGSWQELTVNAADLGLSAGQVVYGFALTAANGHVRFDGLTAGAGDPLSTAIVNTIQKRPAEITITPFDLPFDGQTHLPTFTATGLDGIDLGKGISFGDAAPSAPGTYSIPWTFTSPDPNYADKVGSVECTIRAATTGNRAPQGTDGTLTVTEDSPYTFIVDDFGFHDPNDTPANALRAVVIVELPGSGTLLLDGAPFAAGTSIPASQLDSLTYAPATDVSGAGIASILFRVQDDGGTADGGSDLAVATNTLTITVRPLNDSMTGTVSIGNLTAPSRGALAARQGDTLQATAELTDVDGIGAIDWQWLKNGDVLPGATAVTYTLTQDDVSALISVRATQTDALGTIESTTSAATGSIANVNDPVTGTVTLSNLTSALRGTAAAQQGDTLSASQNLADADGLGTLSWEWLRNGQPIAA